jgi:hypothetical protein
VADRELLLRCDCGVEHLDFDVWFRPGIERAVFTDPELDEGYMTVSTEWRDDRRWRDRVRLAAQILRGRSYLLNSVILSPESVTKLRDFARSIPG